VALGLSSSAATSAGRLSWYAPTTRARRSGVSGLTAGGGLGGEEVPGDEDEERHGGPVVPAP